MSGGHRASPTQSRSSRPDDPPTSGKLRLVRLLLGPYRIWLLVILVAMLLQTAMSIAAPWPLKIILDNVVGTHEQGTHDELLARNGVYAELHHAQAEPAAPPA